MPRRRQIPVLETLQALRRLQQKQTKPLLQARIAMLCLLKQEPSLTLREAAEQLGVSQQATKRWWKWYTEGGVAKLLDLTVNKQGMNNDHLLLSLRDHINSGTFRSLEQVASWLGTAPHVDAKRGRRSAVKGERLGSAALIAFMNALPSTGDVLIWRELFSAALRRLFGDIDRVSVSINAKCDLVTPEGYQNPAISTIQLASDAYVPITSNVAEDTPSERLLKNIKLQGFPFDQYHPPVFYSYYYRGSAYLATLILWREKVYRPISRETIETIESLRSFITLLFTDVLVQMRHLEPANHAYMKAIDKVVAEHNLSMQERRVLTFLSTGASHEMIAESMHIAVTTVRTHLRAVYQKTGVHSMSELFARYFVPQVRKPRKNK